MKLFYMIFNVFEFLLAMLGLFVFVNAMLVVFEGKAGCININGHRWGTTCQRGRPHE